MNKRPSFLGLILWVLTLNVMGCTRAQPTPTPAVTATATPPVSVTSGLVRDAITKLPVAGVRVQAGTVAALSDVAGAFSVPALDETELQVTAPGYEAAAVRARPAYPLTIDLVPDAATTVQIVYNYEQQHEYGREYDLLHPDVQALFSRDDFVRYMEQSRPYDVVEASVGAATQTVSGTVAGRTYSDVAQVSVQVTVRTGEQITRRAWLAYVAKVKGLWRWFRGPLLWPTPLPTATGTSTPTPTPTFTPTPRPTRTLYPTAIPSPTPYTPIAPGNQAVVIVEVTAIRDGTGDSYPIAWAALRGTVLLVLEWPRFADGVPWYRVQIVGTDRGGWARGDHIAALAATPIASVTPTVPMPTPVAVDRIAFASDRTGNREVYVMNADGTGVRNLTNHLAQDGDPSWSPWHDRLAFASDRSGNSDIYVMNSDGSGVVQLTYSPADQVHPVWSPNGAWLAYVSNEDGDWEIYVMGASGSSSVQLTQNAAWDSFPAWSPDSWRIVFTSDRDGNYDLYVYDLANRTETRLMDNPTSDAFPAWSPTGNEIAFTSARDGGLELYALEMVAPPARVTRLTYTLPVSAANRYSAWSHDGAWLAFTSWRDGNAEIYVMRRDGSVLRNLTNHAANDEAPAW